VCARERQVDGYKCQNLTNDFVSYKNINENYDFNCEVYMSLSGNQLSIQEYIQLGLQMLGHPLAQTL
jgi:hypothetical protein